VKVPGQQKIGFRWASQPSRSPRQDDGQPACYQPRLLENGDLWVREPPAGGRPNAAVIRAVARFADVTPS
jgi:hypothetical protein